MPTVLAPAPDSTIEDPTTPQPEHPIILGRPPDFVMEATTGNQALAEVPKPPKVEGEYEGTTPNSV
jgi:hypothetical protein